MNAQVILRIKHKDTLTIKVLFPSQVISMYEGKTFLFATFGLQWNTC